MAIPEPEFNVSVYQLDQIISELDYDWSDHYSSKKEYLLDLKRKCFDHLDTI